MIYKIFKIKEAKLMQIKRLPKTIFYVVTFFIDVFHE